jgi:starch synthase
VSVDGELWSLLVGDLGAYGRSRGGVKHELFRGHRFLGRDGGGAPVARLVPPAEGGEGLALHRLLEVLSADPARWTAGPDAVYLFIGAREWTALRILIASSEVYPYAKSGGLADVAGALPRALARLGHDVRVVMPRHRCVDGERYHLLPVMKELDVFLGGHRFRGQVLRSTLEGSDVPIYFIQNEALFDRGGLYGEDGEDYPDNALRFAFASLATIWMLKGLDWAPGVIQANDWQMALIPTYLKSWPILNSDPFYRSIRVLHTIHNLAYQGLADPSVLPEIGIDWALFNANGLEFYDKVNFMKGGIIFADHVSTVSETYAAEIQTEEHGCGLEGLLRRRRSSLTGILNGIDHGEWDPETDPRLAANYSAGDLGGKAVCKAALQRRCGFPERAEVPLLGVISRLVEQKGFDLIEAAAADLLAMDLQLVILGTGDPERQRLLEGLAGEHPERLSVHLTFDEDLAHQIEAGADLFLMPSQFEPCGLSQLYSLRYGTVPIVRRTGGLADSITDATPEALARGTATGFSFTEHTAADFLRTVRRAVDLRRGDPAAWHQIVKTGMAQDHSWESSARAYDRLFRSMVEA